MKLESNVPGGALEDKWDRHRAEMKLVNPANKRKFRVLVVGTGLAGGSAAASLAELGYDVDAFCYQDSARRAHSIAAQGGINAAKNYPNDGDSVWRLFYDTIKGGDYRAREANVYRLAQVSNNIIDQCVAQGVPFAREYGGLLANRSASAGRRSRAPSTPAARPASNCSSAPTRRSCGRSAPGKVRLHARHGDARPRRRRTAVRPRHRHPRPDHRRIRALTRPATRSCCARAATATSTTSRRTPRPATSPRAWRCPQARGAYFANPCFTQIHPTCIPVNRGLPEQADADEREPAQRRPGVGAQGEGRQPAGRNQIPEEERDYYLEAPLSELRQPRAARRGLAGSQEGLRRGLRRGGLRPRRLPRLRGRHRSRRQGRRRAKYGNLFHMYQKITAEDPYQVPMRIFPAVHYTMGGLWVDYNLMSTIPGLFVPGRGELLRPRRQPPRGQRADAGTGRRLLHRALHGRRTTS